MGCMSSSESTATDGAVAIKDFATPGGHESTTANGSSAIMIPTPTKNNISTSTSDHAAPSTSTPLNISIDTHENASISERPDAELMKKISKRLDFARNEIYNLSQTAPGFFPGYMKELATKLNDGIENAATLSKLSLSEARDISKSSESMRGPPAVIIVDSSDAITAMITHINAYHKHDPHTLDLFMDSEGDMLDGGISFSQIMLDSRNTVYIIDILTLKDIAFTTATSEGITFKHILEDSNVKKAFFDVRGDSHDLWKAHGIHLVGIENLNLYAIACYMGTAEHKGRGLGACVSQNTKRDLSDSERKEWNIRKEWGKEQFKSTAAIIEKIKKGKCTKGDWVPVFNERPIRADVLEYSVQDFTVLPIIYRHCMLHVSNMKNGLGEVWKGRIEEETSKRIIASQDEDFNEFQEGGDHGVAEWKGMK